MTNNREFPIDDVLPALRETLGGQSRALLQAPPGAGKTTQVPLALLHESWLGDQRILMLEPRRIAARSAAQFMAQQLGQPVGDTVGYRIRFETKVSRATRIEVVTEGILTRMIQDDPTLDGVGLLIFDEFHERHLQGDLGLALALDVQASLRPELRILLMSATLDGEPLARFLDAPILSSEGRSFPVQIDYQPPRREEPLPAQLRRCLQNALTNDPGDVLVFLPGQREIGQALAALGDAFPDHVDLIPLHGELPVEAQSAALAGAGPGRRRVVLATNVAESSVTLPGVRVVIDSGLAREPRFDPNSGLSRLQTVGISQASADQRAGRAGRVAEGRCIRLWSSEQRRDPQRRAEVQQVELSSLTLEMAAWGSDQLRFPDALPSGALAAARDLLLQLGALDARQRITALGRRMLSLGAQPRLAAMLLDVSGDDATTACDLAALIEARDPLRGAGDDLMPRWQALQGFRQRHGDSRASRAALSAIDRAASQWRRRLHAAPTASGTTSAQHLGLLLAAAFPDRIAHQNADDPLRYSLSNGRSARLHPQSDLFGHRWLLAIELRHERGDALLQRGLALDENDLRRQYPERFVSEQAAFWDAERGALVARREQRFAAIVLESRDGGRIDPELAAQALTRAIRDEGLQRLPWSEGTSQLLERLRCLRDWMPELDLPNLSDQALLDSAEQWLQPAFRGCTRIDAVEDAALKQALWSHLDQAGVDPGLRRRIEQLAPTRIEVPSGQSARIHYAHGQAPVLAVKLQAMFGLAETPRIADGRIPLTLHLLSPAGRPLQVTADLRHFWNSSYADVRRDMRGRYPRHPWPEDPWSAVATHRAKPRN